VTDSNNTSDAGGVDKPQKPVPSVDRALAEHLVERARAEGVELVGPGGLLAGLTKQVLETSLEVEMDQHLGYAKHARRPESSGNSRNGTRSKTVLTDVGPIPIEVPRDRDATFDPKIVRKRQRRLDGVDAMVISLVAKGLTTGEVQAHLGEVYGSDVSRDTISKITDRVLDELAAWQNRPWTASTRCCSSTRSWSKSATGRSPTVPSIPPSGSPSTASATSWGCGSARAVKARSSGCRC
jgi:hypothetical protein